MPPENGAFIVKNSWGSDNGDNGYYYVSYFDTSLAYSRIFELNYAVGYAFTSVQDKLNYDVNYHYTPFGTTYWFNSTHKSVKYRNNWVASSNELLKACGVYVDGSVNCNIEVFVNNDVEPVVKQEEVQLNYAGFHTINFDNPVKLTKGQKFRIQVTLNSLNYIFVPVERLVLARDSNGKSVNLYDGSSSHVGESEIYENGQWKDITTKFPNANLCLNAYADYYPMITKIDVSDLTINVGENKNVVATLYDKNNNIIKNTQITISINDVTGIGITNDKGQISFPFTSIGTYKVNFNFNGNNMYVGVSKTITVTVNQPIVQIPPQSQPPVSSPTTNVPNNGVITKPTSIVTVLKISCNTGKKYDPTEKVSLTLQKAKTIKVKVTANKKSNPIQFKNYKASLSLSKFNLKNKKTYSFNFEYSDAKYELKKTIKITTK